MPKSKNTRLTFNGIDFFTAICCFAGMLVCLTLFWQDLNMTLAHQNEEPLAVIYFKYNTAQRRLVDRNLWERLKQASPVYNGDRIRTAALSEAVAVFPDGMRLELQENTLVQLFKTEKDTAVEFVAGSLSASTSNSTESTLRITAAGKTMSFSANSSAVVALPKAATQPATHDDSQTPVASSLAINVTKGDVTLRDAEQTDIPVVFNSEDTSVAALLRDAVPALVATVQNQAKTQPISTAPQKVMNAGDFAVISDSAEQITGQTNYLSVIHPAGSTSIIRDPENKPTLSLLWDCPDTMAVRFEFSYDADFATVVDTKNFPAGQKTAVAPLVIDAVHDTLYWRAVSQNAQEKDVSQGTIFIRPAPEKTVEEVLAAVFEKSEPAVEKAAVAAVTPVEDVPPVVVEEQSATSDVVAVADPVVEQNTEPVEVVPEPAAPVILFASLQPALTSPKEKAIFTDAYFEEHDFIQFTWDALTDAVTYKFVLNRIESDGTQKKLISTETKKKSYKLTGDDLANAIDTGKFVWSVIAVNNAQENSAAASAAFSVQLGALGNVEIDTSNMINSR